MSECRTGSPVSGHLEIGVMCVQIINQEAQPETVVEVVKGPGRKTIWILLGLFLLGLSVLVGFAAPSFVSELNKLAAALEKLVPKLDKLEQLTPLFQSVDKHAASIDVNIRGARQDTDEMNSSIDKLDAHLGNVLSQSGVLLRQLNQLDSSLRDVSTNVGRLNTHLANLNQKVGTVAKNLQALMKRLAETKRMLAGMTTSLDKANVQATELKVLLKGTDRGLSPLLPALQESEKKLQHLTFLTKEVNRKFPNLQVGEILYFNEVSTQVEESMRELTDKLYFYK